MSNATVFNPKLAATVLRIALGCVFLAHAHFKLAVLGLEQAGHFFAQHGFPAWTVYPVAFAEAIGGIALVVGSFTRIAALGLIPTMLGALGVHFPNGWYFGNPGGGWEYIAFLIAALGAQAMLGDGAFALGSLARLRSAQPVQQS